MKTRKQFVAVVTLALFMIVLSSSSARTQEQESTASLAETLSWLQGMINNNSESLSTEGDIPYQYKLSDFWSERCTIGYKETQKAIGDAKFKTKNADVSTYWIKTTVPLGSIDPFTFKVVDQAGDNYAVEYHTSAGKKTIKQESDVEDYNDSLNQNFIYFKDKETANRVQRALQHAVKLCGGKVDPF